MHDHKPELDRVPSFDEDGLLNAIIETPKGAPNKYKFDEKTGLYMLGGVMPLGHSFPFDFGFIPQTLGGDGDPLDVLVLLDYSVFVGCLVKSRLIGGFTADQTDREGNTVRNDRVIAVAEKSVVFGAVNELDDLPSKVLDHLEHFFISYNDAKGKKFKILSRIDAGAAVKMVKDSTAKHGGTDSTE
jgi:inorganic pyrophosphatase